MALRPIGPLNPILPVRRRDDEAPRRRPVRDEGDGEAEGDADGTPRRDDPASARDAERCGGDDGPPGPPAAPLDEWA